MCKTWPFMDDLLKNVQLEGIPTNLKAQLRKRYNEHALEYATEEMREGAPVNTCMKKDTVKDIEEELVDACFNTLVLIFKRQILRPRPLHTTRLLWSSLIDTWDTLGSVSRTED